VELSAAAIVEELANGVLARKERSRGALGYYGGVERSVNLKLFDIHFGFS